MGNKKQNITAEDIEAMKILVKKIGFRSEPWCEGVQNYLMDTYPNAIKEIKKEMYMESS